LKRRLLDAAFFVVGHIPHSAGDRLKASHLHRLYLRTMSRLTTGSPEDLFTIQGGPLRGRRIVVHPTAYERRYVLGIHEPETADILSRICRSGDIALDVGAHYGYFTLLIAQLVAPSGRVVACEPLPANAARVRRALRANGVTNAEVLDVALSDSDGTTSFEVSASDMMGRLPAGSATEPPSSDTIDVRMMCLDSLVGRLALPRVDVIKLDVEGAEAHALEGARTTLDRYRPDLVIEVHDFEPVAIHARPLVHWLQSLGYIITDVSTKTEINPGAFNGGLVLARHRKARA